jgi:co-chaperonin GroES (HSP10)
MIPLNKRVLVKRDPAPEQTVNGIHLPAGTQEKERPFTGTVAAVSPVLDEDSLGLSAEKLNGARVYFSKYAGQEVKKDFYLLHQDELMGLVEDDSDVLDERLPEYRASTRGPDRTL